MTSLEATWAPLRTPFPIKLQSADFHLTLIECAIEFFPFKSINRAKDNFSDTDTHSK